MRAVGRSFSPSACSTVLHDHISQYLIGTFTSTTDTYLHLGIYLYYKYSTLGLRGGELQIDYIEWRIFSIFQSQISCLATQECECPFPDVPIIEHHPQWCVGVGSTNPPLFFNNQRRKGRNVLEGRGWTIHTLYFIVQQHWWHHLLSLALYKQGSYDKCTKGWLYFTKLTSSLAASGSAAARATYIFAYIGTKRSPNYLAKSIEQDIEVRKNGAPGHLHDVVQSFAGVVTQSAISIIETCQNRFNQFLQIQTRILQGK